MFSIGLTSSSKVASTKTTAPVSGSVKKTPVPKSTVNPDAEQIRRWIQVPPHPPVNPELVVPLTKYHKKNVMFKSIQDIPFSILSSVAELFKNLKLVCIVCFFQSNWILLVGKKGSGCMKNHTPWKPVRVIRRSPLCVSGTEFIPIMPLPKHMMNLDSPFKLCRQKNHTICYAMSTGPNPNFPHTIEELVIWSMEREYGEL